MASANGKRQALVIAAILAAVLLFSVLRLRPATAYSLWLDEIYVELLNLRAQTSLQMIVDGPAGQGSPSPLFYVLGRGFYNVRETLHYAGLSPYGYARLPSLLYTVVLGLAAWIVVRRKFDREDSSVRTLQEILGVCGFAAYLFHHVVYSFAVEDRPYALWNGLWFLILACELTGTNRPWLMIPLLTLLSLTATASAFQLAALAGSKALVRRSQGASVKAILVEGLILYPIPAITALIYLRMAPQYQYWGPEWGTWAKFFRFWINWQPSAWVSVIATMLAVWKIPSLRAYAIVPTTNACLLLIAPAIYAITRAKGFFFAGRQYIYFSLLVSLAFLLLALSVPLWNRSRGLWSRRRGLVAATVLSTILMGAFSAHRAPIPEKSSRMLFLKQLGLERLQERPRALSHAALFNEVLHDNLSLAAEYISWRTRNLPPGDRTIPLVAQGKNLVIAPENVPQPSGGVEIPIPPWK